MAATISVITALDEDALNGIGFLTIPPLLAIGIGVLAWCVAVARRRG